MIGSLTYREAAMSMVAGAFIGLLFFDGLRWSMATLYAVSAAVGITP